MISIIVTHYKTPGLLTLCLSSLKQAQERLGEESEIVVVDGETQPEHAMIVGEADSTVRFVGIRENVGYAGLVNRGLEETRGRYRLVLNADIVANPNSVKQLVMFMDKNRDVGIAGPQLLGFDGEVQDSRFRFYTLLAMLARRTVFSRTSWGKRVLGRFLMRDISFSESHKVDWLLGSALIVSEEAFNKVGGMDTGFFLYFEDVDWCRRMWDNGYQVRYVSKARMFHYHQRASDSGRGLWDAFINPVTHIHLKSAWRYYRKHRNRIHLRT